MTIIDFSSTHRIIKLLINKLKSLLLIFVFSFYTQLAYAQEHCDPSPCPQTKESEIELVYRSVPTNTLWETKTISENFYQSPYQVSLFSGKNGEDGDRLWSQSKAMFGLGFTVIGVIALLPEDVSNWERGEIFGKWSDNVKAGPVWDRDGWHLNVIGHGYFGGVYYQMARKSGYRQWDAFIYSFMASTFYWEYGIEAFAEVPSIQDIVLTPVLGWIYGEWAYQTEQSILKHGGQVWGSDTLGSVSLALLDPIDSASIGINNLFGHEIFKAGTGYIDMKDVPFGNNGDTESLVQLGVTYQFGSGKKYNKSLNHKASYHNNDPVDISIIGISYGYANVNFDDAWMINNDSVSEISIGLYFSPKISARLSYAKGDVLEKDNQTIIRYENYSINGQYYFNSEHKFRPYITAGFGEMMREKDYDKKTFQSHLGLGLHYQLTKNLAIETDARHYYSTSKKTAESHFTTSLVYRFASGE